MIPQYKVITQRSVFAKDRDFEDETYLEKLSEEQDEKLKEIGFDDLCFTTYPIHFFDSKFYDEQTSEEVLYDAIQMLALKEGCDLVQYENGNYGFIAYYGSERNGFEIKEG